MYCHYCKTTMGMVEKEGLVVLCTVDDADDGVHMIHRHE